MIIKLFRAAHNFKSNILTKTVSDIRQRQLQCTTTRFPSGSACALVVRPKIGVTKQTDILKDALVIRQTSPLQQSHIAVRQAFCPQLAFVEAAHDPSWHTCSTVLRPKCCSARGKDLILKNLPLSLCGTHQLLYEFEPVLDVIPFFPELVTMA
jgi:hypothetical protein